MSTQTLSALCSDLSLDVPAGLPSVATIEELARIARQLIFPGFFGCSEAVHCDGIEQFVCTTLQRFQNLLREQVCLVLCSEEKAEERTEAIAENTAKALPALRKALSGDVKAIYDGDPAAHSLAEVVSCYPAVRALTNYRLAHCLHEQGVPLLPRILTEMAHRETGIDIHPACEIGANFSIDHGTGIVIGETCRIGNNVKLYQGVTLGARSFPLGKDGLPVKGIPRHPIIEDNVIIYSNATILGRITIGRSSVIGANVWITQDVAPGSRMAKT